MSCYLGAYFGLNGLIVFYFVGVAFILLLSVDRKRRMIAVVAGVKWDELQLEHTSHFTEYGLLV